MITDTLHPVSETKKLVISMLSLNFKDYQPDDIKEIRKNLDMSRGEFGKLFYSGASTVKGWELGRRTPTGSAMRVLRIAEEMAKGHNGNINNRIRRALK